MRYLLLFLFIPSIVFAYDATDIGRTIRWLAVYSPFHNGIDTNETREIVSVSSNGNNLFCAFSTDKFKLANENINWEFYVPPTLIDCTFEKDDEVEIIGFSNSYPQGTFLGQLGVRFFVGETLAHTSQVCTVEAIQDGVVVLAVPNYAPYTDVLRLWVDDDDDGAHNDDDDFPNDENETTDTDEDGVGNNADQDDDGDGLGDHFDLFPLGEDGNIVIGGGNGDINTGGEANTTIPNGTLTGYIGNIDTDNDVPTLLQILARLDSMGSGSEGLLESLATGTEIPFETDRDDIVYADENDISSGVLPTEGISTLFSGAGGSMPTTTMQIESHSIDIDFVDSRYDTIFLVAKVGLTSLVVVGSVMGTWKLSGTMLTA
jgi:hypothetical protein